MKRRGGGVGGFGSGARSFFSLALHGGITVLISPGRVFAKIGYNAAPDPSWPLLLLFLTRDTHITRTCRLDFSLMFWGRYLHTYKKLMSS